MRTFTGRRTASTLAGAAWLWSSMLLVLTNLGYAGVGIDVTSYLFPASLISLALALLLVWPRPSPIALSLSIPLGGGLAFLAFLAGMRSIPRDDFLIAVSVLAVGAALFSILALLLPRARDEDGPVDK